VTTFASRSDVAKVDRLIETQMRHAPREPRDVGRLRHRELRPAAHRAAGEGVADLPETDREREDDHVARAAEVCVFVDDHRRFVAIDLQPQADRRRARRCVPHRKFDGILQRRRHHGREAQVSMRRNPHLHAQVQAQGGLSGQLSGPRDELLDRLRVEPRFGIAQLVGHQAKPVEELVGRDVPALDELDELQRVNGGEVEFDGGFHRWPEMTRLWHAPT
jgi:hypothetical protein